MNRNKKPEHEKIGHVPSSWSPSRAGANVWIDHVTASVSINLVAGQSIGLTLAEARAMVGFLSDGIKRIEDA